MAKAHNTVIGLDLGRHALKAVQLQRRGSDRFLVTHYASRAITGSEEPEGLGRELKALFKDLGGTAKVCGVAISSQEAIIRIIEQPSTPPDLLREALRLNGMTLLNQDCRSFVLDCDLIGSDSDSQEQGTPARHKYLVGGVPRTELTSVSEMMQKTGLGIGGVQLAPICAFNAFEFSHADIFNNGSFFLVDIGHHSSTVMVGAKRELVLVRTIDFGGHLLIETLMALSGESRPAVLEALEQEDELMIENTRMALMILSREIGSSIGFFEGRCEETINRIYVSGGSAKSKPLLKVLSEEVHLPCEGWNALATCEVTLPPGKAAQFPFDSLDLNVACGAAAELLQAH